MPKTAVIGAGSWGTALSIVLADNGHDVTLWTRNSTVAAEINFQHTNKKYLPEVELPREIRATTSLYEAVNDKDMVMLVVPSHAMRETVKQIAENIKPGTLIIHATKGLETDSLKRMSEVLMEELPDCLHERIAVLSGPSHAEEVCRRSPTAVVVAATNNRAAEEAQDLLINSRFRVYTNPDMIGLELGGALKNIIALGAGLSDGLGFGDNAKAALLTRGLAEIGRLGVHFGANPLTFAGLAGVGDLVVTCTSRHSRNWRAGYMLGTGKTLAQVMEHMDMVVEGIRTTQAAYKLASRERVEMPITEQLYQVLFSGKSPRDAVEDLMGRDKNHEVEEVVKEFFRN